jgi:acyl carrier protein
MQRMNEKAFLAGLADVLEVEQAAVHPGLELTYDKWDSLARLSTMALIDEHYGVTVSGEALAGCQFIGDLLQLIRSSVEA